MSQFMSVLLWNGMAATMLSMIFGSSRMLVDEFHLLQTKGIGQ